MKARLVVSITACILLLTPVARADEGVTVCPMGGPTPGYKAIKLHLPEGTDFLAIQPRGTRQPRLASDSSNWRLAQGLVIVNADTLAVESHRVEAVGSSPRRVVVRADGTTVVDQGTTAPDGPFYHQASKPRAGLPAGTYYAIGFGSDGGKTLPNEWWQIDLHVGGRHSCAPVGTGQVFDVDHTKFENGSQTYAHAAGTAEDITYEMTTPAGTDFVVGFMDAAVQGPGEATLEYETPIASGEIEDEIVAFASTGGTHSFEADFTGAFPMIQVVGVAVDVR